MTIAEILKSQNIGDDIIAKIEEAMKANNIFTASEENLDIRYGKLKTDHEGVTKQLGEANSLIEELKKSNKGNEDLQHKITDYEGLVTQLKDELEQTKIESAIKVGLLAEKAVDVDYLTFLLKQKGEITLDENGKIKGWDDKLAALKVQKPNMFEGEGKREVVVNKLPTGDDGDVSVTKEQFAKMGYNERLKLKETNEEAYRRLARN